MTTTWTKEQLKSLARASTQKKEEESSTFSSEEDVTFSKRKLNKRAIPKTLFSALLLAPAFGLVYVFANNNLNLNNRAEVNANELDPKTKQLQEELEESNARIEQLEAQLAVINQEQSRPVEEVKTPSTVAAEEVKEPANPKTVAQPPPPKRNVKKQVAARPVTRPVPKPKPVVQEPPPPSVASVFGAGSSSDLTEDLPLADAETTVVADNSTSRQSAEFTPLLNSNYSSQVIHVANQPSINPEMEASLLQEQPMMRLRTGATAQASLAVPWARDFSSRQAKDGVVSVVLSEPLMGSGGKVFLPADTTILVKAESVGQPDIIEFVAVEAYIPNDSSSGAKVALPEGVIRFSAEDGKPLVALPLREKDSQGGGIFDLLDSADAAWQVGNRINNSYRRSDDMIGGVLRGQRQVRNELNRRERYRNTRNRSIVYLPEGTKLKLYVSKGVTVPRISLP